MHMSTALIIKKNVPSVCTDNTRIAQSQMTGICVVCTQHNAGAHAASQPCI